MFGSFEIRFRILARVPRSQCDNSFFGIPEIEGPNLNF